MEAKALQQSGRSLPIPQPPRAVAVGERASFREIWQTPYRRRTVMLVIFHAAQAIGLYGFSNWMPTFLVHRGVGLSSSLEYGLMVSFVAPLGPLLAVSFADRAAFHHSTAAGKVAAEADPKGKAAAEADALWKWLCDLVGTSSRKRVNTQTKGKDV
jgi:hypothetical protein